MKRVATAFLGLTPHLTPAQLHKYAVPDAAGLDQLRIAMDHLHMSARAYDRILKVARTIADLEACVKVRQHQSQAPRQAQQLPQFLIIKNSRYKYLTHEQ